MMDPMMLHPLHDPLPPLREENRQENRVVEIDASAGFQRAAEIFRQSVDERVDPCEGIVVPRFLFHIIIFLCLRLF
jgi:hypothetical protein